MAETTFSAWISAGGAGFAGFSENEALTRALHASLSSPSPSSFSASSSSPSPSSGESNSSLLLQHLLLASRPPPPPPQAAPASAAVHSSGGLAVGGRISKRKPRVSRRRPTTYINADPANFLQMVQQVTGGVRFDGAGTGLLPVDPVMKPEPLRPIGVSQPGFASMLPTLDTSSAFVLGRLGAARSEDADGGSVGSVKDGPEFEFEPFPVFPTLESWDVM